LTALDLVAIVLTGVAGTAVVLAREPVRQARVFGLYGLLLTVLFVVLQAPDVALSELVVSTVAFPFILLLALARVHRPPKDGE
jgi:uncharacterized MnhB-related membrane protein